MAAATILVPLAVTMVQRRRSWQKFMAAGAPAPVLQRKLSNLKVAYSAQQKGRRL